MLEQCALPLSAAAPAVPRLPFAAGERVGSAVDPARRGTVLHAGVDRRTGRTEFYVCWAVGPPGGPHVYTAARLRRLPAPDIDTEPGHPAGPTRESSVPTHNFPATPRPSTWDTFLWPDWVPQRTRHKITEFWSSRGRTPDDWLADARERRAPALGDQVQPHSTARRIPPGRYVHVQTRVGRVIHPEARPEPTVAATWLRTDGPWFAGWIPAGCP